MKSLLIKNALLINEGKSREASVLVVGDTISTVYTDDSYTDIEEHVDEIIDASGKWLLPVSSMIRCISGNPVLHIRPI